MIPGLGSRLQGRDDILVDAPAVLLWDLIADSHRLPSWGPPVTGVQVLTDAGEPERLGTARRVHARFGRRSGWFLEHRVQHVQGRRVAYLIDEETFGLSRLVSRPGFSLELIPLDDGGTRVVFSFFHDPRGVQGGLLNRHCCIEPECAGEPQQSGGSPSWKGAKKGSNHSTVPMICRL
jgi:hypothetical protein